MADLLSVNDRELMLRRVEEYHEFKTLYEDAYSLCCNVGEGIRMFSKDLAGFDRNTLQIMIGEMLDMEIKNGTQPPCRMTASRISSFS